MHLLRRNLSLGVPKFRIETKIVETPELVAFVEGTRSPRSDPFILTNRMKHVVNNDPYTVRDRKYDSRSQFFSTGDWSSLIVSHPTLLSTVNTSWTIHGL